MKNAKHTLPLVDGVLARNTWGRNLNNTLLIGVQHLLSTTHCMIKSLESYGLRPENTYLLGKVYSSNDKVATQMTEQGLNISPRSFHYEWDTPYDISFSDYVVEFLKKTMSEVDLAKFDKVILLDDGGRLISAATRLYGSEKFIGVEQTSSGIHHLLEHPPSIPVINVARTQTKLSIESPWIAHIALKAIQRRLAKIDISIGRCLILGGGAIGRATQERASQLWPDCAVYDPDESLSDLSVEEFTEYLESADLIIGCTGKSALSQEQIASLKKGAVLASVSSSDREFQGAMVRKRALLRSHHAWSDVFDGKIWLLNNGFPVNFEGTKHSVPPHAIQLTRALLATAVHQAASTDCSHPGLIELDHSSEDFILNNFKYKTVHENTPSVDCFRMDVNYA